ncbi:MAG: VOC family protein [Dehalococcoidia bacterium]|nr:VOC family protein [Dehalococcoidia bacterium]
MDARYTHTNLVARDWRRLAAFYEELFGCVPVPPERDLSGEWLSRATGVTDAAIRGVHLRLPGYGDDGPTLEIFQYSEVVGCACPAANRQGYGHIAFAVNDVAAAAGEVVRYGGSLIGEVVTRDMPGIGVLVFAYAADPEGNIIELQQWSGEPDSDSGEVPWDD